MFSKYYYVIYRLCTYLSRLKSNEKGYSKVNSGLSYDHDGPVDDGYHKIILPTSIFLLWLELLASVRVARHTDSRYILLIWFVTATFKLSTTDRQSGAQIIPSCSIVPSTCSSFLHCWQRSLWPRPAYRQLPPEPLTSFTPQTTMNHLWTRCFYNHWSVYSISK